MKKIIVPILCDFYKISHRRMYPTGTQTVYSTWTPRTSRIKGLDHVVWFGGQAFYKEYLIDTFNDHFFNRPKAEVISEYTRLIKATLGDPNPETSHLEELHDLGFLPLSIKALPEGTVVPTRVPVMTIQNTDPRFFWLTNFIESLASCELWQASTSATLAMEYKSMMDTYANETNPEGAAFTIFQGHDFSMRGMSSLRSSILSGMGHLVGGFAGTDTIPAICAAEYYYNANVEKELVGTSVPATEHSIQCAYGDDMKYLRRMLSEVHPSGIVSIVSDGYDFWDVLGRIVPSLKKEIMARSGGPVGDKVVIRPDSGDPVLIVCGDPDAPRNSLEYKGAVEVLWDIFGGTMSSTGYRNLDSHIGLIYGDAITLRRAEEIMERLKLKGFASTNVVFGIGSYTYQYNTRDTFGFALKSTLCVINGDEKLIFKDPKTDDGVKKSQKGKVVVYKEPATGEIKFKDGFLLNEQLFFRAQNGTNIDIDMLQEVFRDGKLLIDENFSDIRARIATYKIIKV
jgi:nicotinamide phosphoribosyltransferase